ncbi:MAG TPA: histidine ammonia-lyase [Kofleriaceae bacterium]|nr:histidine ammonia-lyase [Kofleriaceae bacterium]
MHGDPAAITLERYRLAELAAIAAERRSLDLHPDVRARIQAGARHVASQVERGRTVYGVTTGFGALAERAIPRSQLSELQHRHVVSHACGVGPFAPEAISRLALLIKLLTFRGGHTGITVETVERLLELWNRGAVPAIPLQGTVGASGDLAPLAHMALPLLGLGHVHAGDRIAPAGEVLAGQPPVRLEPKEGLALTNGIQFISAIAVHCVLECARLARAADAIASLSIQGFSAARDFFAARYHETSLHRERGVVAGNLRALLDGGNHHELRTAVASRQDPYSFRCIPQVHGAVRQTIRFAHETIEDEVNGVSDNPLFFPDEDLVLCGGALHGESIAMVLDFLAIAASELASISERRTYQLLSGRRGLPDFLVAEPGLNSGFMVAQYTAASLVNHNKVLCTPASIDTIPTCQLQEDHVSMGGTSGIKLLQILDNCAVVLGIELLAAAQAVALNEGLVLSERTAPIVRELRRSVAPLREDRVLADDIAEARRFVDRELPRWTEALA